MGSMLILVLFAAFISFIVHLINSWKNSRRERRNTETDKKSFDVKMQSYRKIALILAFLLFLSGGLLLAAGTSKYNSPLSDIGVGLILLSFLSMFLGKLCEPAKTKEMNKQ